MSDGTLNLHGDGSATLSPDRLSPDRLSACLSAAWELEALAQVLPGLVPNLAESGPSHFAVRGIADRIRRLSCAVMSGLSDDAETLANLEREVLGTAQTPAA